MSTDLAAAPRPGRAPSASACEPYRELIADALRLGRNAMAIWQDLIEEHGFTARYASVRCFVLQLQGTSSPEARVVITTAPGQVDYGDGPMVRHPQTGKYRRTRLFVLRLGYSRKAIRLLVWQLRYWRYQLPPSLHGVVKVSSAFVHSRTCGFLPATPRVPQGGRVSHGLSHIVARFSAQGGSAVCGGMLYE